MALFGGSPPAGLYRNPQRFHKESLSSIVRAEYHLSDEMNAKNEGFMRRIDLDGTWELTYGPQQPGGPRSLDELQSTGWPTIPATVPGNVELDLIAAGHLPELSFANNISRC